MCSPFRGDAFYRLIRCGIVSSIFVIAYSARITSDTQRVTLLGSVINRTKFVHATRERCARFVTDRTKNRAPARRKEKVRECAWKRLKEVLSPIVDNDSVVISAHCAM
jgi:hypothetical protein